MHTTFGAIPFPSRHVKLNPSGQVAIISIAISIAIPFHTSQTFFPQCNNEYPWQEERAYIKNSSLPFTMK